MKFLSNMVLSIGVASHFVSCCQHLVADVKGYGGSYLASVALGQCKWRLGWV